MVKSGKLGGKFEMLMAGLGLVSFIICCSVTPVQLRRCFFFFEEVNQISRLLVERYTIFGGSFNKTV